MNVMVTMMKTKLLTLMEIVQAGNEFLDTNPEFHKERPEELFLRIENPDKNPERSYDDIIDIFVCERYARFKLRDPINLIEYDLSFLPWYDGFNLNIWYDGSINHIDRTVNQAIKTNYISSEEEYFQESTLTDYKGVNLQTIIEVKKLHDRMFNYFQFIPVEVEVDGK